MLEPWQNTRPPRVWQRECLPIAIAAAMTGAATIVSAVTGAGKSTLIAELVSQALPHTQARGHRIVISTPTQSLVAQLSQTIADRIGWANVGQYYGSRKQPERTVIVTCTPSVASLGTALAKLGPRMRVSLLIADDGTVYPISTR